MKTICEGKSTSKLHGGRLKPMPKRHSRGEKGSHRFNLFSRFDCGKAYDRAGKLHARKKLNRIEIAEATNLLFD